MKTLRKLMCALLCFSLLVSTNTVFATEKINIGDSIVNDSEKDAQEEIDDIFGQLNNLATEKRAEECLATNCDTTINEKLSVTIARIASQEQQLNNRLEELGVRKIDPNSKEDMEHLEDVVLSAWKNDMGMGKASSIPAPPDLNSLADCYSLYQYTGTTTVDGVSYNYSYIRVTDNKGYSRSPLTSSKSIELVEKKSMLLSDLLSYNFSFGFSAFLGSIPYGWAVDWGIGNVTTVFNSIAKNSPITYVGNSNIYQMAMLSVTQMQYCYVCMPSGYWMLCGVNAPYVGFTRSEQLVANVNGRPYSDSKNYPTASSSTGISAISYVSNYVRGGLNSTRIDSIGSFTVISKLGNKKTSTSFAPGFCSYPLHLA